MYNSDNYVTLPVQQTSNQNAISRALQMISQTGQALPCIVTAVNGALVTVNIEARFPFIVNGETQYYTLPPITLPKAESQWLRAPTQVGDVGLTIPADTFLGGISGQGSGVATVGANYGNLTTLVWVPVAATGFTTTPDPNKPFLNGPNGALVGDTALTVPVEADATLGVLGVGGRAATLNVADRAAAANNDLNTLVNDATNGIIAKTLQTLASAIGAASVTAGIPNAAAFSAILSASGWVKGLSGIEPTIPSCSSIVRLAE